MPAYGSNLVPKYRFLSNQEQRRFGTSTHYTFLREEFADVTTPDPDNPEDLNTNP